MYDHDLRRLILAHLRDNDGPYATVQIAGLASVVGQPAWKLREVLIDNEEWFGRWFESFEVQNGSVTVLFRGRKKQIDERRS